jgi:hypothetical protein
MKPLTFLSDFAKWTAVVVGGGVCLCFSLILLAFLARCIKQAAVYGWLLADSIL